MSLRCIFRLMVMACVASLHSAAWAQAEPQRVEISGQRSLDTALTQPSTTGSRLGLTPLILPPACRCWTANACVSWAFRA